MAAPAGRVDRGVEENAGGGVMQISEKQYEQAQADAIRLRQERDAALDRAIKFEDTANQEYAEKLLLRNECIRLREAHGVLAGFIESLPDEIPPEVNAAENAVFPPERPKASGCPYTDSDTRKELAAAEIRIDELGAEKAALQHAVSDIKAVNEKLEAERDRLREAAVELLEVADLRGDAALPYPADDPRLWTARMQQAWDDLRAALAGDEAIERKDGGK
jgi:hypothetical protein